MADRSCGNCDYWYRQSAAPITETDAGGQCRRRSPLPVSVNDFDFGTYTAAWPSTGADQFCGEFERKPRPDDDEKPF